MERGASSNAACKRLTGQTPGSEPLPVRSGAWGGQTGLRVVLENTLTGARVPGRSLRFAMRVHYVGGLDGQDDKDDGDDKKEKDGR